MYSWTFSSSGQPLLRQLFSRQFEGHSWHALEPCDVLDSSPSLVGLCVGTNAAGRCDVIVWEPRRTLWTQASVQQTAPTTRILPQPNAGGGLSRVDIRIWDAEGNRSLPFLQYQLPGTSNWTDATVLRIDGHAYGMAMSVEAMPTGTTHRLLWDSGGDLGAGFSGTVLLQARSVDITMWGKWSEPILYHVAVTGDSDGDSLPDAWELARRLNPLSAAGDDGPRGDPDGDGVDNLSEYLADTDPLDGESFLAVTGVSWDAGGLRIGWQGGTGVLQYLLRKSDLMATGEPWTAIFTNEPPTERDVEVIDAGVTNGRGFYRVGAERK